MKGSQVLRGLPGQTSVLKKEQGVSVGFIGSSALPGTRFGFSPLKVLRYCPVSTVRWQQLPG